MKISSRYLPALAAISLFFSIAWLSFPPHAQATPSSGLWGWGRNYSYWILGTANTQELSPVSNLFSFTQLTTIAEKSYGHVCAVIGGGAKCWGYNDRGQVGNGGTLNQSSPLDVPGLTSGVSWIDVGNKYSCALTAGGGVKCWGDNTYGQLGDGQTCGTTYCPSPVNVTGLTSGVQAIATGLNHACALTTTGGIKCWGSNSNGQLGDGQTCSTSFCSTPVNVTGLTSGVDSISAGGYLSCAVTTTGGAKCWGMNGSGQVGDGQACGTTACTTPANVTGLTSGVASISAGYYSTCAVTTGGGAKCWGMNSSGELGDNKVCGTSSCKTPVDVSGLTSGVQSISAGNQYACALTTAGGVKCWGNNSYGDLGDGTGFPRFTPVDAVGLTSGVTLLHAGNYAGYAFVPPNPGAVATTLSITNVAPSFTTGPSDGGSSGTSPTNAGTNLSFSGSANDPNGDQWYIAFCKTSDAPSPGDNAPPTCPGGSWVVTPATSNGFSVTTGYATSVGDTESNDWWAFVCDKVVGGGSCSAAAQGSGDDGSPFKVNHRPSIGTVTVGNTYGSTASIDPGSGDVPAKITTTFGGSSNTASGAAIQTDGKIVAAGYSILSGNQDFAVARYNTDLSLDPTFGVGGKTTLAVGSAADSGRDMTLQTDGKIIEVGVCTDSGLNKFCIARFNSNGTPDSGFGIGGKAITPFGTNSSTAEGVATQSDGKIVVAGYRTAGSDNDFALVRYNSDGSLDNGFGSGGLLTTNFGTNGDVAFDVAIQTDGKIVAAGSTRPGSVDAFAVARYNTDGSLDTSFDGDGMVTYAIGTNSDDAYTLVIQPDGKIVVGGQTYKGVSMDYDMALIRLNTDGSLDTSFDGDGKVTTAVGTAYESVESLALQTDGKIIASGSSQISGQEDFVLVRYNTDGSLDTSFDGDGKLTTAVGTANDNAKSVVVQGDGKIVAVGYAGGSPTALALVRYTASGTIDTISGNGRAYVQVAVTDTDVDTLADTVSLFACSTNNFTGGACGGTTLCSATGIASGGNAQCNYTGAAPIPTAHGSYPIYLFLKDSHNFADAGTANTQSYSVTDVAPTINSSNDYMVNDIALTSGGSTVKAYLATIRDDNGDTDLTGTTAVLYDDTAVDLASGTCTASDQNCYPGVACTPDSTNGDNSLTYTCNPTAWFNADHSANWRLHANPTDGTNNPTNLTDSNAIATNALSAIDVPELAIAYGTVVLGAVSNGQAITLTNMGNQILDVLVQGTDMTGTPSGTIPLAQQKWHNTLQDFTYAEGNTLVASAAGATTKALGCADRNLAVRSAHDSGTGSDESLFWKLQIPSSQTAGSYSGTNTLIAAAASQCSDGE